MTFTKFVSMRRSISAAATVATVLSAVWGTAHAEDIKSKVGFYPGALLSFPAFVAQDQGFFKANGLDVKLVPIPDGAAMTAAVASGSIHFANNSYDNLSTAVSKGLPLKAVVGATTKLPLALIARNDVPLPNRAAGYPKVMEDIKDLKMGVIGLGISSHFLMEMLVAKAGLSPKDATYIAVGLPSSARPALKNKSVDTYLSLWPLPVVLEAKGEGTIVLNMIHGESPDQLKDLAYNGWLATNKTIGNEPEMVKRFVRANEQAYCYYSNPANFDKIVSIVKKNVPIPDLDDQQYRAMIKDILPGYGVSIPDNAIAVWQSILVDQKQLDKPLQRSDLLADTVKGDYQCQ